MCRGFESLTPHTAADVRKPLFPQVKGRFSSAAGGDGTRRLTSFRDAEGASWRRHASPSRHGGRRSPVPRLLADGCGENPAPGPVPPAKDVPAGSASPYDGPREPPLGRSPHPVMEALAVSTTLVGTTA